MFCNKLRLFLKVGLIEVKMDIKRQVLEEYTNKKTEVEFMKEVLTPLFESMGFDRINFNHGANEYGKDYIFSKKNEFNNTEYYACVVKRGDIQNTGKAKNTLEEVERQIGQCFRNQIQTVNGPKILPSKVLIVCSGRISHGAEEQIRNSLPSNYNSSHVNFISSEELIPLLDKHTPYFFEFKLPTIGKYMDMLTENIKKECSGDSKYSSVLGKVDLICFRSEPDKIDTSKKKYEELKVSETIKSGYSTWLQGGTGAGKTYVAHQYINKCLDLIKSNTINEEDLKNFHIVFYFKCKEVSPPSTIEELKSALLYTGQKYYPALTKGEVDSWIEKYNILYIFDEFEKNSDPKLINSFVNISNEYGFNPTILVLSRIMGEFQVSFERLAPVYFIKDLNLNDAVDLVRQAIPSNASKAYDCFQDLVRNGVLERIPRTPLAINVLSHVFSNDIESSPNNAYEFFDMFFELVLGRWRAGRDLGKSYDYRQVRSFFENAAFKLVEIGETKVHVSELLPIAQRILEGVGDETTNPEAYIYELCKDSEVAKIDNEDFEFFHRTYLEFLAGCVFSLHKWDENFFIQNIINPLWEDALIFSAGAKRDCDSLIERLKEVDESFLEYKFFKLKNISLVLQALYQSSLDSKVLALNASLETVKSIKDDVMFKSIIGKKYPNSTELTSTLVCLGLYSTFYGRKMLAPPMLNYINATEDNRDLAYLLSALSTLKLNDEQVENLNLKIKGMNLKSADIELIALNPFFKSTEKQGKIDLDTLKELASIKKIKKLGKKVQQFAKSKANEFLDSKIKKGKR